ncbi:MAG: hypothetical protein AAGJ35_14525, partial [Myxococcota bacterium]
MDRMKRFINIGLILFASLLSLLTLAGFFDEGSVNLQLVSQLRVQLAIGLAVSILLLAFTNKVAA